MPGHLLIDNWTLQNAGEFLHRGLCAETAHELLFSVDGQSFRYADISRDIVALECMLQVLYNAVFEERLLVDADFADSWLEFSSLAPLTREGTLIAKPFRDVEAQWGPVRESMADQLCFCAQVRQQHEQNKAAHAAGRQSSDPMLAQLLWGGAGMLARAAYFRVPYSPHPLRERLFARAKVLAGPTRAADQLQGFIETERLKLFQRLDGSGFYAQIRLPPVVGEILETASTLQDLIPAALHVRERYSELRGWLTEFQIALDAEDAAEVLGRRKLLESVGRHVNELSALDPAGDISLQFGLSWPKVTTKVPSPVNWAKNRFGIRAQIKRLILAPSGQQGIRKLLRLLGEEHTEGGANLLRGFLRTQNHSQQI